MCGDPYYYATKCCGRAMKKIRIKNSYPWWLFTLCSMTFLSHIQQCKLQQVAYSIELLFFTLVQFCGESRSSDFMAAGWCILYGIHQIQFGLCIIISFQEKCMIVKSCRCENFIMIATFYIFFNLSFNGTCNFMSFFIPFSFLRNAFFYRKKIFSQTTIR